MNLNSELYAVFFLIEKKLICNVYFRCIQQHNSVMCACEVTSVTSDSLWPCGPQPTKLLCPWDTAAAAAKSLQSCPTLSSPTDGSPWGSPVPGILQARTLEWVAISFSNAWKSKVKVESVSRVWLLATPWTAASQAPPSMGFSRQECFMGYIRQEYWSR